MSNMSGYELNDHDIQVVLERLKAHNPDATEEDAKQVLLEEKMKLRNENLDEERKAIYPTESSEKSENSESAEV